LDDLIWEQTRRLLEQPDLVVKEYSRRTQKKQRQRSEFKDILIKKRREIKQRELAKERLLDLYQSGEVSLTEIEQRLKAIRTKIKKVQDECALLEKEEKREHHRVQVIEQFTDFTQRMKTNLSILSFEERRQIVRLLVEEVLVNTSTDEITVRHILPLDEKFPLCKRSTDAALRRTFFCRFDGSLFDKPGLHLILMS
jgi:polyribonucleotide nucleotidyltransferase